MNKPMNPGARIAAAGLAGAAAGTLAGAIGLMVGQAWFGTSLFIFQPTPRLGGLVATILIGALGCGVGLLVGITGGQFPLVNAVLGGCVGLLVAGYEVVAHAARFTAYELTISPTALVGCVCAALAAGELSRQLANRGKSSPPTAHPTDNNLSP
jgi:hypothetical protein